MSAHARQGEASPRSSGATGFRSPEHRGEPEFRYGVVFLITLTLVVFEIVAPAGSWERAVAVGLAGAGVIVAFATWRARTPTHDRLTLLLGGAIVAMVAVIAAGAVPDAFVYAAVALLVVAISATIVRGLLRLVRERGATVQAIAGALSLYLMLGLLFASAIAFVADVEEQPYFAQGANVSTGDIVYYSFTALTTTGFGDYSAATPVGHALAVLEMLAGQIFLATVIGVLIGHYVRRRE